MKQSSPYSWAGRPWRTADLATPLIGATAVWLAIGIGHLIDFPWWGVLLGDVLLMLTALRACAGLRYAEATRAYTLGFALFTAAFSLWCAFDLAWSPAHATRTTIIGLLGTGAAFIAWPLTRRTQIHWEEHQRAVGVLQDGGVVIVDPVAAADQEDDDRQFWADLFAEAGLKKWECKLIKDTPAGIAVRMRAPAGARLSRALSKDFAEGLESHLDIRAGGVRLERFRTKSGPSSREMWVHIDYEDILAKIIRMPDEHHEISINRAFPVGRLIDGREFCLRLRDIHTMIIGATRKGKSHLVHVIIHQLTRCYDASVWLGDVKGGSTAKPWLRAWLAGDTDRPILGWVGIDRFEIERMIRAAVDIAAGRPLRRHRGDKTQPQRAGKPMANGQIAERDVIAIVLIVEEMAETVGAHTGPKSSLEGKGATSAALNGLITSVMTTAAGEGVYAILVSQRETNSMFATGDAKTQIGNRIAVGPMSAQDAASMFPGRPQAAANVTGFQYKGCIQAVVDGSDSELPAKGYFLGDDDEIDDAIYRATILHTPIVPDVELDTVAAAIANQYGFADRWTDRERCGWTTLDETDTELLKKWQGKPYIHHDGGAAPRQRGGREQVIAAIHEAGRLVEEAEAGRAARAAGEQGGDNVVRGFWGRKPKPAPTAAPPVPVLTVQQQRVNRVVAIIDTAGQTGITAGEIVAQLITEGILTESSRTQIYRYLKAAMDDGGTTDPGLKVVRPGGAGVGARYYTHRHVAANATASTGPDAAPAA